MASNKRTIYLGLDYSQFTGGVTEVNRKMSLLDAEFKRATAEAKNYGTETDQLALKQDYLTQKIALQNQKVEAAKKAYDEAMKSQNASQKEIDELDKRLLNERTRLEQLNGELSRTQRETLKLSDATEETNRKIDLLDAEFERASAEAKNYGKEADQLALKQDYLTQKIELQNQKVEEAQKAYDAMASSQNASQKDIDELNKALLNEKTKLEQLKGELIDAKRETSGLDEANKKLNDTMKGLALGIGAAFAALTKFAVDTADAADELKTLSAQTGISTTELQRLDYASKFIDVDLSTMTGSVTKLEKSMDRARNGSKELTDAFKKLHVRTTDNNGKFRDANDVFYEVIDALGRVKNETELDTLAMELFGKSAKELKPLIEAGSKSLKEYGDEAERHSLIMSEDEVNAAASFKDSMDRLNAVIDRLKQILGEALMPILEGIADFLSEVDVKTILVIGAVGGIIALIYKLVTAISAVTTVMAAQSGVQMVFNATAAKTIVIILAIVAAIALLVFLISQLTGKTEEAKKNMKEMEGSAKKISQDITNATYSTNNVGRRASGTDFYQGGRTWVGEEGPELVDLPRGSKIYDAKQSAQMAGSETNYYYITIDAKNVQDFNRVVELAQNQRMALRRV